MMSCRTYSLSVLAISEVSAKLQAQLFEGTYFAGEVVWQSIRWLQIRQRHRLTELERQSSTCKRR